VKKVTIKCQLVSVVAKKKPRVLMRYLLQMTMATDEVTERLSAGQTSLDVISAGHVPDRRSTGSER
jgi:hypothetical protein